MPRHKMIADTLDTFKVGKTLACVDHEPRKGHFRKFRRVKVKKERSLTNACLLYMLLQIRARKNHCN